MCIHYTLYIYHESRHRNTYLCDSQLWKSHIDLWRRHPRMPHFPLAHRHTYRYTAIVYSRSNYECETAFINIVIRDSRRWTFAEGTEKKNWTTAEQKTSRKSNKCQVQACTGKLILILCIVSQPMLQYDFDMIKQHNSCLFTSAYTQTKELRYPRCVRNVGRVFLFSFFFFFGKFSYVWSLKLISTSTDFHARTHLLAVRCTWQIWT